MRQQPKGDSGLRKEGIVRRAIGGLLCWHALGIGGRYLGHVGKEDLKHSAGCLAGSWVGSGVNLQTKVNYSPC